MGIGLVAGIALWRRTRPPARSIACILAGMLLVIAPWAARNAIVTGTPNPTTFFGPYNLWLGCNHRMYEMYKAGESGRFPELLDALYANDSKSRVLELQKRGIFDAGAADRFWLGEVAQYVREKPGEVGSILWHRLLHYLRLWPNRATVPAAFFWMSILSLGSMILFAAYSLGRHRGAREPLLLLPMALGLLTCLPFFFELRYRFPVLDPYLAVLAAPAVVDIVGRLRRGSLSVPRCLAAASKPC